MAATLNIGIRLRIATSRPLTKNLHLYYHTRSYHISTPRHAYRSNTLIQSSSSPRLRQPPAQHGNNPSSNRPLSIVPIIETALTSTQHLFSAIHSTGLPWFLTIPLIALSLNIVTRWPISVYTNKLAQRRAELAPILQAWYGRHSRDIGTRQTGPATSPEKAKKQVEKQLDQTSKRLFKAYRVQRWKDYLNLGILPIWLLNIEALRRLSGAQLPGLLGTLMYGKGGKDTTPEASPEGLLSSPPDPTTDLTTATDLINTPLTSDPTLSTGGCLWFPDLMVPDPLHILPCMLSILLALNVIPTSPTALRAFMGMDTKGSTLIQTPFRLRLQRALVLLSLAVGPLTMQLPAAIHLYWVSSTAITMLVKKLADKLVPIPKTKSITPCRGRNQIFILPKREETKKGNV